MALDNEYLTEGQISEKLTGEGFERDNYYLCRNEIVGKYADIVDIAEMVNYEGREYVNNCNIVHRKFTLTLNGDSGVYYAEVRVNGHLEDPQMLPAEYTVNYGDEIRWKVILRDGYELFEGEGLYPIEGSITIKGDTILNFSTSTSTRRLTINVPEGIDYVMVNGTKYFGTQTIICNHGTEYTWEAVPKQWYEIVGQNSGAVTVTEDTEITPGIGQKMMARLTVGCYLGYNEWRIYVDGIDASGKLFEGDLNYDLGEHWLGSIVSWDAGTPPTGWNAIKPAGEYGLWNQWSGTFGDLLSAYNSTENPEWKDKEIICPGVEAVFNELIAYDMNSPGIISFTVNVQPPRTQVNGDASFEHTFTKVPGGAILNTQWGSTITYVDMEVEPGYNKPNYAPGEELAIMAKRPTTLNIIPPTRISYPVTFEFGTGVRPKDLEEISLSYWIDGEEFEKDFYPDGTFTVNVYHGSTIEWLPNLFINRYIWTESFIKIKKESIIITEPTTINIHEYSYGTSQTPPWAEYRYVSVQVTGLPDNYKGGVMNDADVKISGWWTNEITGKPNLGINYRIIQVDGYESSYSFSGADYEDLIMTVTYTKIKEHAVKFEGMNYFELGPLHYGIFDEGSVPYNELVTEYLTKTQDLEASDTIYVPDGKILVWTFPEARGEYSYITWNYPLWTKFLCAYDGANTYIDHLERHGVGQVKKITEDVTFKDLVVQKMPLVIWNKNDEMVKVTIRCLSSGIGNSLEETIATTISVYKNQSERWYFTENSVVKMICDFDYVIDPDTVTILSPETTAYIKPIPKIPKTYRYKFVWDASTCPAPCVTMGTNDVIAYHMVPGGDSGGEPVVLGFTYEFESLEDTTPLTWYCYNDLKIRWARPNVWRNVELSPDKLNIINLAEVATDEEEGISEQFQKLQITVQGHYNGEVSIIGDDNDGKYSSVDIVYVNTRDWGRHSDVSLVYPKEIDGYKASVELRPYYGEFVPTSEKSHYYPDYDVVVTYVEKGYHNVTINLDHDVVFENVFVKFGDFSGYNLQDSNDMVFETLYQKSINFKVQDGKKMTFSYMPVSPEYPLNDLTKSARFENVTNSNGPTSCIVDSDMIFELSSIQTAYFRVELSHIKSAKIERSDFETGTEVRMSKTITSNESSIRSGVGRDVIVSEVVPEDGYEYLGGDEFVYNLYRKTGGHIITIVGVQPEAARVKVTIIPDFGRSGVSVIYNGGIVRNYPAGVRSVILDDVVVGSELTWISPLKDHYRLDDPSDISGEITVTDNTTINLPPTFAYGDVIVDLTGPVKSFRPVFNGVKQRPIICETQTQVRLGYPKYMGVDLGTTVALEDIDAPRLLDDWSTLGPITVNECKQYNMAIAAWDEWSGNKNTNKNCSFIWEPINSSQKLTQLERGAVVAQINDPYNSCTPYSPYGAHDESKWRPVNNKRLVWGDTSTWHEFESSQVNLVEQTSRNSYEMYSRVTVNIDGNPNGSCVINGQTLYDGDSVYVPSDTRLTSSDVRVTSINGYTTTVEIDEYFGPEFDREFYAPDWVVYINYYTQELVPVTIVFPDEYHGFASVFYKLGNSFSASVIDEFDGYFTAAGKKQISFIVPNGETVTIGTDGGTNFETMKAADPFSEAILNSPYINGPGANSFVANGPTTKYINTYGQVQVKLNLDHISSATVTYRDWDTLETITTDITSSQDFNRIVSGSGAFKVSNIKPSGFVYKYNGLDPVIYNGYNGESLTITIAAEDQRNTGTLPGFSGELTAESHTVTWECLPGIQSIKCVDSYGIETTVTRRNSFEDFVLKGVPDGMTLTYYYNPAEYCAINSLKVKGTLLINEDKNITGPDVFNYAKVDVLCGGYIKQFTWYLDGKSKGNVNTLGLDKYSFITTGTNKCDGVIIPAEIEIKNIVYVDGYGPGENSVTYLKLDRTGRYEMPLNASKVTRSYQHTVKFDSHISSVTVNDISRANGSVLTYTAGTVLNIQVNAAPGYLVANNLSSSFSQTLTLNTNAISEFASYSTTEGLTNPEDKLKCDLVMEENYFTPNGLPYNSPEIRNHYYDCYFVLRNISDADLSNLDLSRYMSPEYITLKYSVRMSDGSIIRNNTVSDGCYYKDLEAADRGNSSLLSTLGGLAIAEWDSATLPKAHQSTKSSSFMLGTDSDVSNVGGPITPTGNKDTDKVVGNYYTEYEAVFAQYPWKTGSTVVKGIVEAY